MRYTLRSWVLLAALLLLPGLACASEGQGGSQQPSGVDRITFVTAAATIAPKEEVATYAVAKELGYFKEENLQVSINQADGSTAALQAVASGSGDVTAADGGSVLAAVAKGVPVVSYAGLVQNWPWRVATLPDSGIREPADLKGKRLGVISLASGSAPYARGFLSAAGLTPDEDTQLVPVGVGPPAASALREGEVSALALYTQAYTDLENATGTDLRYLENPPLFDDLFSLTWTTTTDLMERDPELIARFTRASYKALLFSAANPEAAMRIGYEEFPELKKGGGDKAFEADVESLKTWIKTATPVEGSPEEWGEWGRISEESWDSLQNFTIKYARAYNQPVDIDKVWDPSLLEQINDFDRQKVLDDARNYKP